MGFLRIRQETMLRNITTRNYNETKREKNKYILAYIYIYIYGMEEKRNLTLEKVKIENGVLELCKEMGGGKGGNRACEPSLAEHKLPKFLNHKNLLKTDLFCIQNWKEKRLSY
jgi:hypothetical protein